MSLYFTNGSGEDLNFECEGYNVEHVKSGRYEIARIRGIKAQDLVENIYLKVNSGYIDYCPMTYCYRVVNGGSDNPVIDS